MALELSGYGLRVSVLKGPCDNFKMAARGSFEKGGGCMTDFFLFPASISGVLPCRV